VIGLRDHRRHATLTIVKSVLGILSLLIVSCLLTPTIDARAPGPKVLVAWFSAEQVAALQRAVPEARLVAVSGVEDARAHVADADALVGVVDPELVRTGKKLRWVQVLSAGVDRYRFPELVESDIVLTNAKVIQGPNVADQAMALLLVLTRRVHHAVRRRDWEREPYYAEGGAVELEGKSALVLGTGGIGTAIARRAHGFGMRVVGVDVDTDVGTRTFIEAIEPPDRLHALLPGADVVFVAVPLTPQTEGMIGEAELARMKDGAYLVNIARGKIVDTDALVDAMRRSKLAGAGLDVTEPEPLPPNHPLWDLENVVVTPHVGGASDGVTARRLALVEDNLRRFVAGQPLVNVVDKQAGY
jgi:phosphoglycerate dehydrogenase-like enzyme